MSGRPDRLDNKLRKLYPGFSRSLIQKLIKNGNASVQGKVYKKVSSLIKDTEHIELQTETLNQDTGEVWLDVLYEDENCVVVNKPPGLLTHSKGVFNPEPTIASWLKNRRHFSFPLDAERGGIVHRLDRATSGVIIAAKNKKALATLQKQFQQRKAKKVYLARVSGVPAVPHAILDLPIERNPKKPQTFRVGSGGKNAQTEYRIIETNDEQSLLELRPTTGRTHQLRVHLSYTKHPIVGDELYGGEKADRLFLHAKSLEITIPGSVRKIFIAPEPKIFHKVR